MDPRSKSNSNVNIPHRPVGQRPATAQRPALPPPHSLNQFAQMNPWFMGGTPMGGARFGNYTFSAVICGLFPLLNFQVHGFPDTTSYGPVAGFPYGYPHGGHAYGYPRQVAHGLELDVYLKVLLIMGIDMLLPFLGGAGGVINPLASLLTTRPTGAGPVIIFSPLKRSRHMREDLNMG